MARLKSTTWQRYKYLISALVLLLTPWYYYQSLHPVFPDALAAQKIEGFEVTAMPYDTKPPYQHDGHLVKDFLLMFSQGDVSTIRQAYLNIGQDALLLDQLQLGELAILHGSPYGQTAHALVSGPLQVSDKIWLTVELWNGQTLTTHWLLPDDWIPA